MKKLFIAAAAFSAAVLMGGSAVVSQNKTLPGDTMMEKQYFDLFTALIKTRPVTKDAGAVNRAQEMIKAFLDSRGIHTVMEEFNGRKTLYASTVKGKVCDYLLNVHVDVVPAINESQFEPQLKGNLLYGRGSSDDLPNAILAIQTLCDNKDSGISVGVIFTSDEEVGGSTTLAMVKKGFRAQKCVLVLDSWGNGGVIVAQKGIITLKLVARGRGGHSSAPWALENPIEKLCRGYLKLHENWVNPTELNQWGDSMAAVQVHGGFAHNQVPDVAEMMVNIRYTVPGSCKEIVKKVETLTGLEVELLRDCPPCVSDRNSPELIRLLGIVRDVRKNDAQFSSMNGATDARHMGSMNVPVAIMGVHGSGGHSANEFLYLESYKSTLEIVRRFISGK